MADSKRNEVLSVCIAFFVLSWTTVTLRIWVRAGMLRSFGKDDWAMLATQVMFTAYLACQLGGIIYGTGQHLKDLEFWRAEKALSFWFFCEIFYLIATVLMKVAIGLFLLRVATKPLHIWIIRVIMVCTVIFGLAFDFIVLFQCWPISAFWTLNPADGHCINKDVLTGLTYGISALNVIADWTFGILPIFIVKDLVISKRQKGLVAGILAFAAVGSTATIVRLPFIPTLAESYLGWDGDFLYDTVGVAIWTTVEVGIGITAGCIATLRPLLQLIFFKFGISSTAHASRTARSRGQQARHAQSPGLPLDGLAKGHGVITTITGTNNHDRDDGQNFWHSRGSSQEQLSPQPDMIMKNVIVEYDEIDTPTPPNGKR